MLTIVDLVLIIFEHQYMNPEKMVSMIINNVNLEMQVTL